MKMIAIRNHPYRGKSIKAGAEYEVRSEDVRILRTVGFARPASVQKVVEKPVLMPVQKVSQPVPRPIPQPVSQPIFKTAFDSRAELTVREENAEVQDDVDEIQDDQESPDENDGTVVTGTGKKKRKSKRLYETRVMEPKK